jgi:hypothetical protein
VGLLLQEVLPAPMAAQLHPMVFRQHLLAQVVPGDGHPTVWIALEEMEVKEN